MTNAFSVLSLKRNRSTTSKGFSTTEPVSKLSKLKSGFSIFSKKLSHSISQHHHHQHDNNFIDNKTSFIRLFQYFRSNEDHHHTTRLHRKNTYDSDRRYEYSHYHKERNIHTLTTASTKKLTSILIKRSGTNPSSAIYNNNNNHKPTMKKTSSGRRPRTYSNATISNMTINSEDLTAKEFADIAGIRILPEEQDERKYNHDEEEDLIMQTVSSSSHYTTTKSFDDHHERLSVLSYTSGYSSSSKLKIWDNEFWLNPEVTTSRNNSIRSIMMMNNDQQQQQTSLLDRKLSTTISSSNNKPGVVVVVEPPILHELRRMGTRNNSEKDHHCVIKKGRFEIHLGDTTAAAVDHIIEPTTTTTITTELNNDTTTLLSFSDHQTDDGVLEWKRKGKKSTL